MRKFNPLMSWRNASLLAKAICAGFFKKRINDTISEYINLHRIAAGRQLIMEGKYSVKESRGQPKSGALK